MTVPWLVVALTGRHRRNLLLAALLAVICAVAVVAVDWDTRDDERDLRVEGCNFSGIELTCIFSLEGALRALALSDNNLSAETLISLDFGGPGISPELTALRLADISRELAASGVQSFSLLAIVEPWHSLLSEKCKNTTNEHLRTLGAGTDAQRGRWSSDCAAELLASQQFRDQLPGIVAGAGELVAPMPTTTVSVAWSFGVFRQHQLEPDLKFSHSILISPVIPTRRLDRYLSDLATRVESALDDASEAERTCLSSDCWQVPIADQVASGVARAEIRAGTINVLAAAYGASYEPTANIGWLTEALREDDSKDIRSAADSVLQRFGGDMYSDAMIGYLTGMCSSFGHTRLDEVPAKDTIEFFLVELHSVCASVPRDEHPSLADDPILWVEGISCVYSGSEDPIRNHGGTNEQETLMRKGRGHLTALEGPELATLISGFVRGEACIEFS